LLKRSGNDGKFGKRRTAETLIMAKTSSNEAFNAGKEIEAMKRLMLYCIASSLLLPSFGPTQWSFALVLVLIILWSCCLEIKIYGMGVVTGHGKALSPHKI
jgi:hypothetical protein